MNIWRASRHLLRKTGDIFEWSYVEKAQFLNLCSMFVALYVSFLLLLIELLGLVPQHDLDGRGSIQLIILAIIYAVILLVFGLVGFPLRKRATEANWYVHLSIQSYCIANVIILYYVGIFSLGTGVALAGGPITGLILFQRRFIYTGLASGIILATVFFYLTAIDYIPYAPLISEPGNAHTNLAWIIVVSGLVIPHIVLLLATSLASINRWQEREERVRFLSSTDVLTQVANRRHLVSQFEIELSRASRDKTPLSILMVDLDHFKSINDQFGHQVGDEALRLAASVLKNAVRKTDLVGRYGGEEFCILLPGASLAAAQQTAERCRYDLEQVGLKSDEDDIHLTASFGLTHADQAHFSSRVATIDNMLKVADQALYEAKQAGRNRVITHALDA